MANAFFVRCDCRNRRFTGGKSRFLQEADGRKGIASAADELCGSALCFFLRFREGQVVTEQTVHGGQRWVMSKPSASSKKSRKLRLPYTSRVRQRMFICRS